MSPDLPVRTTPPDRPSARRQVLLAIAVGLVVAIAVAVVEPALAPIAGFDAAALLYVARLWWTIWPLGAEESAELAVREDPTRRTADVLLLTAAVASLVAVGFVLTQAAHDSGAAQGIRLGLGVLSVIASWSLVHSIFTLKYAQLYYVDTDGGIDFKNEHKPPYSDFAYVAFTIGMTFQVSDTDFQHPDFRRLALRHALLSYLFGTVIIASAINLVAGLGGGGG